MSSQPFATTLPADLKKALDEACRKLGLRKNHVVEMALREKIEDLLDAHDLQEAISQATAFHLWRDVKKGARRGRK